MQTINMNSELVCRYVKLYDIMCKCKNINVNFIAKYAKYNVHGPLGRNYVQVYLNEGIEMENENARRKIRTKIYIYNSVALSVCPCDCHGSLIVLTL